MNSQIIETALNKIKVDSRGYLRGKSKCIDEIFAAHSKKLDSDLMDVRIYVAKISTTHSSTEVLKMIDEFIYKKQL